jgi:hypothetical protein
MMRRCCHEVTTSFRTSLPERLDVPNVPVTGTSPLDTDMNFCPGSNKPIGRVPSPPDEMPCQVCGKIVAAIKPTPKEDRKGLQARHAPHFRDEELAHPPTSP